jgi:hypothetical protein
LGVNQSATVTIDLQPCETVYVEVQVSVPGTNPARDAALTLKIRNNAYPNPETLASNNFACVVSCTETAPRNPSGGEGYPLRGTRGDAGLAEDVVLTVTMLGAYATGPVTYTLIVHRQPRTDYNIGGTDFTNAPIVSPNTTLYASLSTLETGGQYYKFTLHPGEYVYLGGLVQANSTFGATFRAYLYSANFAYLTTLADFGTHGITLFPNTWNFTTYTNNSGNDATYYLRIRTMWDNMWDVQIQLRVPTAPQLKLFLDTDNNFGTTLQDEAPTYRPGTNSSGNSVTVPATEGVLQTLRITAAFVDSFGTIIPPPTGVGSVTFSLPQGATSAFKGYAMNAGTSTTPDFALTNTSASFSNKAANAFMNVFDFGGVTTINASVSSYSASLQIPLDTDNNLIADAGWKAWDSMLIQDGSASADDDGTPTVSGPPANVSLVGDGLTRYEEYRGFIVYGTHRRTNPDVKDLFLSAVVLSAGVDMGAGYIGTAQSGLAIHKVKGLDETATPEYSLDADPTKTQTINDNATNGQTTIPGYNRQRALRIARVDGSAPMTGPQPGVPFTVVFALTEYNGIGTCALTGGGSPNQIASPISIFVDQHERWSTFVSHNTQAQIDNEIRRNIAHEIGHGVHLLDRPVPPNSCTDGANPGSGPSVMDQTWNNGPSSSDPKSVFNPDDVAQIRLHVRP